MLHTILRAIALVATSLLCLSCLEEVQRPRDYTAYKADSIRVSYRASIAFDTQERGEWLTSKGDVLGEESIENIRKDVHIAGFNPEGYMIFLGTFASIEEAEFSLCLPCESEDNDNDIFIRFILLGNMPFIDADGRHIPMEEAIENIRDYSYEQFAAFQYYLDGRPTGLANARYMTINEIRTEGIPYSAVNDYALDLARYAFYLEAFGGKMIEKPDGGYEYQQDLEFYFMKRLFSRIDVDVITAGILGGNYSLMSEPRIKVVHNTNFVTHLSSAANKAADKTQTIEYSNPDIDCDACWTMQSSDSNMGRLHYSLYCPENNHGNNYIPSNTNTDKKSESSLLNARNLMLGERNLSQDEVDGITYLEFSCKVQHREDLYTGNLIYRFYPGANSTNDFSLVRNCKYNIQLSFKPDNLFNDKVRPEWKMEVEDLNYPDEMLFCITADKQHNIVLPQGQDVVVRPNRAARIFPYLNKNGLQGSTNELSHNNNCFDLKTIRESASGKSLNSQVCITLSDTAHRIDFTDKAASMYGVQITCNQEDGYIEISALEDNNWYNYLGKSIPIKLSLQPAAAPSSGEVPEVCFNLIYKRDMGVDWSNNFTYFSPGMKGYVDLLGYYGDLDCFLEGEDSNESCIRRGYGDESMSIKYGENLNPLLHYNPSLAKHRVYLYNYYSSLEPGQVAEFNLAFKTKDILNDGMMSNYTKGYTQAKHFSFLFKNHSPYISLSNANHTLDPTGIEQSSDLSISIDHNGTRRYLTMDQFDPELFRQVYTPALSANNQSFSPSTYGYRYNVTASPEMGEVSSRMDVLELDASYTFYRKCFDQSFRWRGNLSETSYNKSAQIYIMPCPDGNGYKHKIAASFYLSPVADFSFGPVPCETRKEDWTLMPVLKLDSPRRATVYSELASAANINYGNRNTLYVPYPTLADPYVKLIARPLSPSSYGYAEGESASIKLHCDGKDSAWMLYFTDRQNNKAVKHSAGRHAVVLQVTNRHSKEMRELVIDNLEFEVYLNLLMGGYYETLLPDISNGVPSPYEFPVQYKIYPTLINIADESNSVYTFDDITQRMGSDFVVSRLFASIKEPNGYLMSLEGHNLLNSALDIVYYPGQLQSGYSSFSGWRCKPLRYGNDNEIPTPSLGNANTPEIIVDMNCLVSLRNFSFTMMELMPTAFEACHKRWPYINGFNAFFYDIANNTYATSLDIFINGLSDNHNGSYIKLRRLIDVCPSSNGWLNYLLENNYQADNSALSQSARSRK